MKICTIVGARPQFIKAAAVSRAIGRSGVIKEMIIHTGQHYDSLMSDVFFKELNIPQPKYLLGIGSGPHGQQTGRMLESIESTLLVELPDWVLLYGDTNSTLAGAIAAAKLHIPIAHVEAGLRSFNRIMPEEINRILTDHASTLLFAPTETARSNLLREGIDNGQIALVGDVMLDATLFYRKQIDTRKTTSSIGVTGSFILATIHRAENTDNKENLQSILEALNEISKKIKVVLPLHPRTKNKMSEWGLTQFAEYIHCIEPVGYLTMIALESTASVIVTDSGGVQKEAYFHEVPCVTLREETEWTELISTGWNRLVSPKNKFEIVEATLVSSGKKGQSIKLYGDGNAAEKIVSRILGNS